MKIANFARRALIVGAAAGFCTLLVILLQQRPAETQDQSENLSAPTQDSSPVPSALSSRAQIPVPALASASPPISVAEVLPTLSDSTTEPQFAAFNSWLRRFAQADDASKKALEEEGIILARQRLNAFADLVLTNPQRALELALPRSVRGQLPESIRALLEEPINAKGDLAVIASLPAPGMAKEVPPVFRTANIYGESYHAFTFGKGLNYVSKQNIALNGFAVPLSAATKAPRNPLVRASKLLVFTPSPARPLENLELNALKQTRGVDAVCSVSGQSWAGNHEETAAEVAGDIVTFCGPAHLRLFNDQAIAASGQADYSESKGVPSPTKSTYTEGRKRMFLMRPYWSDQAVAMSTNSAITHFLNFSNYMWQMSYGKLKFAAFGEGSDISTELLIPGSVTNYVAGLGSGAGEAWQAVRDVARTNYGYDLSQYDFLYYVTGSRPSASYAGLGFVGGVGFHLANGYFDAAVSSHEYGHNLGLNHAHFWDTSQGSIIGAGANVEYGDNNDPMGGGGDPNQYNSRYKNYLGWITNTDIATITVGTSNRYRLYRFDQDFGTGLRGLRFANATANSDYYWINFRQRKTTKAALMNGAQLLWTDNGNGGSYLLDVRLKGNADDNAIVIGRTFSDPNLNFHFTPIGKGNTYPESIDIVAVAGVQTGNLPPLAIVSANTLNPAVGASVSFNVTASDPNNDALAYYWEFGDGADSYSSDNKPTQTHSFASAGEYAVRCVVSDMRGGLAHHTVIVRVGSPAVFRISGHVVDQYSKPMIGALVTAGSKSVYVDSDGSYVIPGLTAGSYTVSTIEPLRGATGFVHPFFNNPVTLGPNAQGIDFIVGTGAPPVSLVATGAIWKYLDDGSDQGTAWRASSFSDLTWSNGPSRLGYGNDGESTPLSYGPDSANKYITYYFRHYFNVTNPAAMTNLLMSVRRDDGAIVYLNGVEVFRNNMPTGTVTYTTLASGNASDDGDTWFPTNIPPSLFVAGTNVLAAEVHQDSISSSDIGFDLTLTAEFISNVARAAIVYVDSPADNATFTSPTNIAITAIANSAPAAVTNVDIYDGNTKLGSIVSPPYTANLNDPSNGLHVLRAVSFDNSGIRRTSGPVNITVTAPLPPSSPPIALMYLQTNAPWRYWVTNVTAPVGWQNVGFNDNAWSNGIARLGFNLGLPSPTNINTPFYGGPSASRFTTAYFRTPFVVNDPAAVTNLTVTFARDDGIVVYLNGAELFRNNMNTGTVAYATLASGNASDNGQTYFTYNYVVPPAGLLAGTNIISAEVHQSAANSSDMAFDLWLNGLASTNRSRGCWLVSPTNGSTISVPGNATLTAEAVVGGNLGIASIAFYSDGVLIGQDTTAPYAFAWNNPAPGAHSLVAVANDSAGGSVTSAPVNVTVPAAPTGDALISFGDMWKYLDDGSDQGTSWKNSAYNDNQWMMGPAQLGYGGNGETTIVSYGTNANSKYVTTYFRKKFVISSPAAFSGLLLRLVRDDGAVVYLNGNEVFRTNLLAGPISYNSLALTAIGGADETTPVDVFLSTAGLVAGTNTVAVEMHQDNIASSDLSFDLALIGLRNTNTADGVYITSPANNAHYNVPATIPLSAHAASSSGAITLVEYYDGTTKVAQSTTAPYSATWSGSASGNHSLTAVATFGAGQRMTSPPIAVVVGSAPAPIAPVYTTFFNYGALWKYWDSASPVANGWQTIEFNDSAWPSGNGRFGWGLDGESTLLTEGRIAHYFRRAFVMTNGSALESLTFNALRDDGIVVYFNGAEVFRTNMPAGLVTGATLASATVNTPDETIPVTYTVSIANYIPRYGTNVVAVELHQSTASSSDAGFDLSLYGEGTTEPRIFLSAPANGASLGFGAPNLFEAQAQAASGRSIVAVEFFSDGTNFGQATNIPFRVNWSGSSTGTHTIFARMVDDLGASVTSAPVQVFFGYPTVSLVLVPSGSVWKYLDDGTDQGTNFAQTNFNDSAWASGPGELGYGDLPDGRPEATVMCCSNAVTHPFTHYFRREFIVPPETYLTNLTFRLLRDDGALVWLNGREMYRSNMPPGTVTYITPATTGITGADEAIFFATTITTTNAHSGTNLIAVEVHQNSAGSSDLSFDLQLEGDGYVLNTARPAIAAQVSGEQLTLTWPGSVTGYQLYSSPEVGPGASWQLVSGSPVLSNGVYFITVPATNPAAFYRLQK
jgi:hypothetical protein